MNKKQYNASLQTRSAVKLFLRKSINSFLDSASDSGCVSSELCCQSGNSAQAQVQHMKYVVTCLGRDIETDKILTQNSLQVRF